MWICIITNNAGINLPINDLGIILNPGEQRDFGQFFTIDQVKASKNLFDLVASQGVIVNNGRKNLNVSKGLQYLEW